MRESERRRYADPTFVDKVIELDAKWREGALPHSSLKPSNRCSTAAPRFRAQFPGTVAATRGVLLTACAHAALASRAVRFKLDHINREYNANNKEVAKKKMVRPRPALGATTVHNLTALCTCARRPRRTPPLRLQLAKRSTSAAFRRRCAARSALLRALERTLTPRIV